MLTTVKNLKYLGCEVLYENEKDMQQNLARFAQTLGILNNILKLHVVQKFSGIEVYTVLALPILLYGREIWTHRKRNKKRLTSVEVKFFRRTAGTHFLTTKGMKKFWKS